MHPKELIIAASRGNLDLVNSILKQGVDINTKGEDDKTALMLACEKGHEEIVEYLITQGADMTIQTDWGYTALTASMVECEGLGNIRNELIITLIESGVDVVKILIEYGAKVNWKNHYGHTALGEAREEGYMEIEKILIDAGAS